MKKTTLLLSMLALMLALLAISASAAETVIYENDFSDAATLSDFKQYRAEWEIKDGGLYLTDRLDADAPNNSPATTFAHILYQSKQKLTDYIVEVDYMNVQTSGGIIFRADQDAASDASSNAFYGYLAFVANDAAKGALGCGDQNRRLGGNTTSARPQATHSVGSNVHIKVIVKAKKYKSPWSTSIPERNFTSIHMKSANRPATSNGRRGPWDCAYALNMPRTLPCRRATLILTI